ncbi:hypothetical protein C8N25_10490 [Algoriphagus antarcticus]|uniref:Uncharacterized protein n=1 Tax=Algoriphagus antarcticus TaxID=238540 RepID=A0A3E0E3E8_9BACT|nr:hypothetical protein C8N25_10490 [Algoriphagus antarcticus]
MPSEVLLGIAYNCASRKEYESFAIKLYEAEETEKGLGGL